MFKVLQEWVLPRMILVYDIHPPLYWHLAWQDISQIIHTMPRGSTSKVGSNHPDITTFTVIPLVYHANWIQIHDFSKNLYLCLYCLIWLLESTSKVERAGPILLVIVASWNEISLVAHSYLLAMAWYALSTFFIILYLGKMSIYPTWYALFTITLFAQLNRQATWSQEIPS